MYDQYTGGSLVGIMQHHHHNHPAQQQQQHQQQPQHHHQQPQQQQHPHAHHAHQQQQQPPHHHHQHQQQQHQQQQQQQAAFMSATEHQWLPEDGPDEYMPKIVQRRAKRIIPDTEKDDKYWEKRKRNNMAAKRSRENKRLLESDIRQKVCSLEEQNALLRKEVALIKNRYGIPADQSFLTPEERAECMQEVKNAQEERNNLEQQAEKTGSPDGVSSTSSGVYPVCMHDVCGEDEDRERKTSSDGTNPSPNLKDEDLGGGALGRRGGSSSTTTDTGYGPSAYGPFNPSPCWGPAGNNSGGGGGGGANDMHGYGNSSSSNNNSNSGGGGGGGGGNDNSSNNSNSNLSFSPPVGSQAKLPPISNAFHDKSNSPYGRYVNNGLGMYGRPPYDYFMQYAASGQHNAMLYGTENDDVTQNGIAPADLSTSRNRKQHQHDDVTRMPAGSRGVGLRNTIGSVSSKDSDLGDSDSSGLVHTSIPNTVPGQIIMDDVTVMASGMGLVPRSQDLFLQTTRTANPSIQQAGGSSSSSSTHGGGSNQSLPTETARTANNSEIGGPEQEHLKRENDALKMAVRTLSAQVEHMKDQVYKD